ncbi:MAG: C40 family peptidase [Desulfobacterales bacterium]|nr:C40 family peptidase [Desulfobacterales bacterium]
MDGSISANSPGLTRQWVTRWVVMAALLAITACGPRETLVVPPPPIPPPPAPPKAAIVQEPFRPGGPRIIPFTIQVGAFKSPGRAATYAERLQANGVDAYYFIDKDGMSKVRFERFATLPEAHRRAKALQARGLIQNFFIAQPTPVYPPTDSPGAIQESIVATARRFLGSPYRYGKASHQDGFDCSGLTMTVYRLHGLELPRSSADQFYSGKPVGRDELQAGDLVFFATGKTNRVSHVGIYSGQGQFIHAATREKAVRVSSLSNSYFQTRYKGARRYL